eukprot:365381-Chlamydomonas_euryale.AAC.24
MSSHVIPSLTSPLLYPPLPTAPQKELLHAKQRAAATAARSDGVDTYVQPPHQGHLAQHHTFTHRSFSGASPHHRSTHQVKGNTAEPHAGAAQHLQGVARRAVCLPHPSAALMAMLSPAIHPIPAIQLYFSRP